MKKTSGFIILIVLLFSCTKKPEDIPLKSYIISGIKTLKGSELVSIKLDSGVINTTPIDCYVMGATVFDTRTNSYGFVGCDSVFRLIDPLTGIIKTSFRLPAYISQVVIDPDDNTLIGRFTKLQYTDDPDTAEHKSQKEGVPILVNYITIIDLETGNILSQNQINIGNGIFACSYYYNRKEKQYVLLRSDNTLISINPFTGGIDKTVTIGKNLGNIIFNPDNKTITGISFSPESGRNYIEIYNSETGIQISVNQIDQIDGYYPCISEYEPETNCFMIVNSNYEIMFIDVSTGKTVRSVKLNDPLRDIKFWKR